MTMEDRPFTDQDHAEVFGIKVQGAPDELETVPMTASGVAMEPSDGSKIVFDMGVTSPRNETNALTADQVIDLVSAMRRCGLNARFIVRVMP